MKIIRDPQKMRQEATGLRREGRRIGFVPTMGYLHEGHLSLVRLVKPRVDVTVASIFVNPAQFGPNEDLASYPRDFDRDERLCREAGVDVLFYPEAGSLYLEGHSVWVEETALSRGLCGASRPGHFRGVCTVVLKLLNLVGPDVMVLGEKDAQQLRVIRRMVRDLNLPVEILAGPTVREADGLAMSSRNARLSPEARGRAVCLSRALERAQALVSGGERSAGAIRQAMEGILAAASGEIDYIELCDDETLKPVGEVVRPVLAVLAVRIGGVRLIDNRRLCLPAPADGE